MEGALLTISGSGVGALSIDGRKKVFNGMEKNRFRENNWFAEVLKDLFIQTFLCSA